MQEDKVSASRGHVEKYVQSADTTVQLLSDHELIHALLSASQDFVMIQNPYYLLASFAMVFSDVSDTPPEVRHRTPVSR